MARQPIKDYPIQIQELYNSLILTAMDNITADQFADTPALLPPSTVVSNFAGLRHSSLAYGLLIVYIILSTLAVAGRAYTKWVLLKSAHIGDCKRSLISIFLLQYIGFDN